MALLHQGLRLRQRQQLSMWTDSSYHPIGVYAAQSQCRKVVNGTRKNMRLDLEWPFAKAVYTSVIPHFALLNTHRGPLSRRLASNAFKRASVGGFARTALVSRLGISRSRAVLLDEANGPRSSHSADVLFGSRLST